MFESVSLKFMAGIPLGEFPEELYSDLNLQLRLKMAIYALKDHLNDITLTPYVVQPGEPVRIDDIQPMSSQVIIRQMAEEAIYKEQIISSKKTCMGHKIELFTEAMGQHEIDQKLKKCCGAIFKDLAVPTEESQIQLVNLGGDLHQCFLILKHKNNEPSCTNLSDRTVSFRDVPIGEILDQFDAAIETYQLDPEEAYSNFLNAIRSYKSHDSLCINYM